jgi:hypothetical protein
LRAAKLHGRNNARNPSMTATVVSPLKQAGQTATVQTSDGGLVTGIWAGKGTGIVVGGGKIVFPKD